MRFLDLVAQISAVDGASRLAAGRSLQQILSLRNWAIGASIVEFEQAGEDRAGYGQRLIPRLAEALGDAGCKRLGTSSLKNFGQVALADPGLDPDRVTGSFVLPLPSFGQTSGEFNAELEPGIQQTSAVSSVVLNFHDLRSQSVISRPAMRSLAVGLATIEIQDHGF